MEKTALSVTRQQDFAKWYQAVVQQADLAETSPVRGCMIIKPWGYGIWELVQQHLDRRIKETGHENCYFPLFIPLSFIAKEADHVEGFAKEMAVVTHHRLKTVDGRLQPDPEAELEEPLIVRPTSETIIGDAFHRWVQSHRDLPVLINQWANVVRWEMRTRLFLRTTEFLWQEGHTAHATKDEAVAETMRMLEVYRTSAEEVLAMPVITGEKTANERFPGAVSSFSIEAMMQDGKALQAGTSHYLGTHFAEAQDIRYQAADGGMAYVHTTSWGVSTRLIGGVIMTHGDDDGLRLPPRIAPRQIVLVPMLRDKPEDEDVLRFCAELAAQLTKLTAFGEPVRALVDTRPLKPVEKRWQWVRRGVPLICEIGPRDTKAQTVSFFRRDRLRSAGAPKAESLDQAVFISRAPDLLREIQARLYDEARDRLKANIRSDVQSVNDLSQLFGSDEDSQAAFRGWVRARWSRPTGAALEAIDDQLKALKLTIRNVPLDQTEGSGRCLFTGAPATEEIIIARAY